MTPKVYTAKTDNPYMLEVRKDSDKSIIGHVWAGARRHYWLPAGVDVNGAREEMNQNDAVSALTEHHFKRAKQ